MKIKDLENLEIIKEIPIGATREVEFRGIRYQVDKEGCVEGVYIQMKGYRSIFEYIPVGGDYILQNLGIALGAKTIGDIKNYVGKRVRVQHLGITKEGDLTPCVEDADDEIYFFHKARERRARRAK